MPSIKAFVAKLYAARIYNKINKWASNPIGTQERVFQSLISDASASPCPGIMLFIAAQEANNKGANIVMNSFDTVDLFTIF